MEYKTKGKEGTNAKGQKKETRVGKVNKKRGNDGKRPVKEKKDKADDISNNFPNFSVLNDEEKLAFFEALSAARKNIEKRGLPTRERFGTVHDEYLLYFARDDKEETVQKKPESAPSARPTRSPVPSSKSPKESKVIGPGSPKQRVPRTPGPVPPPKKAAKPPQKNARPESEPNDFCEAVIKRDTEQMVQMYLNKKKRIEEQWKKSSQANKSPPPAPAKPKNREATRPPSGRVVGRKEDPRAKTPSKPADNSNAPQSQETLAPPERKEAPADNLIKNHQQKNEVLTPDGPSKGGDGRARTDCLAAEDLHGGKKQQQQPKNLRVKVTLTSGDNKRLCRTKSQVLSDCAKEGSGGKSKSLESVLCPDTPHGKQSKIPILRKAPQDRNECSGIKTETQPVQKIACEDSPPDGAPIAAETKKAEAPVKEKPLPVKEEHEKKEEVQISAKQKAKNKRKNKKAEQLSEECEDDAGNAAVDLAKTKAELKKVRKEKEKALAEASKKEKELLKKKKKQEWRKRHPRKDTPKKKASKDEDCLELKVIGVRIPQEKCLEGVKKEHLEKKSECEKEELKTSKTNMKNENECEEKESTREHPRNLRQEDECEEKESMRERARNLRQEDECEENKAMREQPRNLRQKDECEEKESMREHPRNLRQEDECEENKAMREQPRNLRQEDECEEKKAMRERARNLRQEDECEENKAMREQPRNLRQKDECEEKESMREHPRNLRQEDECEENKAMREQPRNLRQEDECEEKKAMRERARNLRQEDECEEKKAMREHPRNLRQEDECEEKKAMRVRRRNLRQEDECEEKKAMRVQVANLRQEDECEKMSGGRPCQKRDCVEKEQEEEGEDGECVKYEEKDSEEESEESFSSDEEEGSCQQSSECQAVAEECQQQLASDHSSVCEKTSKPDHDRMFSSQTCNSPLVKAATQSRKSLAGVSLVEKRPEETWQAVEMAPTFTTGKVVVVDDNVIKRIKDLIRYLEEKVSPKDNLQSEYVQLVLNYTEYLTKVTESLLLAKKQKKGRQVHSTYAAPEVHLKFEDKDEALAKEEQKKGRIPHSISEDELQRQTLPGPSGIEKKEDSRRKKSGYDLEMFSDSESSSNSEEENRALIPSAFKKPAIPMTKIRLLQDLLKGRAKFTEGSIDDFKIVHIPEADCVPPEKPPNEEAKAVTEAEGDQGQKATRMKFLRNLAKFCNCGKKQIEEDAILENLKGEAVRVDTAEAKKDPASATINDSTMEVLKAAERKKIIEKYLKREQS